jgi:cyclin-dependent kinase 5 activator 1
MSTSSSVDFPLNNFAYEQLNNVKNRENNNYNSNNTSNNGNMSLYENTTNIMSINNNISNSNIDAENGNQDRQNGNQENVRILSEKNAIEKNLKKHSLFINALSWKRLSSHSKKKLDSSKNKTGNLNSQVFRPASSLTDTIHPLVIDKNTNYHQQQIQFPISNGNFTPNGPKSLMALDLVRSTGNTNPNTLQQQHIDKLGPKLPIQLTLPLQPTNFQQSQQTSQPVHHSQIQNTHVPRKTVIQVSELYFVGEISKNRFGFIFQNRLSPIILHTILNGGIYFLYKRID